jgi:hypothetical protein
MCTQYNPTATELGTIRVFSTFNFKISILCGLGLEDNPEDEVDLELGDSSAANGEDTEDINRLIRSQFDAKPPTATGGRTAAAAIRSSRVCTARSVTSLAMGVGRWLGLAIFVMMRGILLQFI